MCRVREKKGKDAVGQLAATTDPLGPSMCQFFTKIASKQLWETWQTGSATTMIHHACQLLMSSACKRFTCDMAPNRSTPPKWHIVGVPFENQTWQGDIQRNHVGCRIFGCRIGHKKKVFPQ